MALLHAMFFKLPLFYIAYAVFHMYIIFIYYLVSMLCKNFTIHLYYLFYNIACK